MSETFEYRQEFDFTAQVDEIAARIQRRVDQAALDKAAGTLAEYGYVKVVRCRDCKHYDRDGVPSDVYPDRYWCDIMTVYILPDGFCSEAKRVDE